MQYRVTAGPFAGALVVQHFVNSSGNADCRFALDFPPHRAGEIVVVPLGHLAPEPQPPSPAVPADRPEGGRA